LIQNGRRPNFRRIHSPFLAQHPWISIARHLIGSPILVERPIQEQVRIVALICDSNRRPIRRLKEFTEVFYTAIDRFRDKGIIVCPPEFILHDPTPEKALAKIEQVNPHVLFTLCHGERKSSLYQWEGWFVLKDQSDGEAPLRSSQIRELLNRMQDP